MGLFRKKSDPISKRAKTLNQQIAALQEQIQRLSDAEPEPEAQPPSPEKEAKTPPSPPVSAAPATPQPRLRSTAFPQKHQPPHPPASGTANPFAEPVFEEVGQSPAKQPPEPANPAQYNELGVRKYDLASFWRRWKSNFRGPATSNPKLVNYLAAGSIQGLRPLRYEKRVARNRFIFLVLVLVAVLWGLIAVLMKRS
jgi:hypothetical protein